MRSEYALSIQTFLLTTIRSRLGALQGDRYGVRMVGQPEVGRPMVMFGPDGNRRIVTSPVVRMFGDARDSGTYVETKNTLYLLRAA